MRNSLKWNMKGREEARRTKDKKKREMKTASIRASHRFDEELDNPDYTKIHMH